MCAHSCSHVRVHARARALQNLHPCFDVRAHEPQDTCVPRHDWRLKGCGCVCASASCCLSTWSSYQGRAQKFFGTANYDTLLCLARRAAIIYLLLCRLLLCRRFTLLLGDRLPPLGRPPAVLCAVLSHTACLLPLAAICVVVSMLPCIYGHTKPRGIYAPIGYPLGPERGGPRPACFVRAGELAHLLPALS